MDALMDAKHCDRDNERGSDIRDFIIERPRRKVNSFPLSTADPFIVSSGYRMQGGCGGKGILS